MRETKDNHYIVRTEITVVQGTPCHTNIFVWAKIPNRKWVPYALLYNNSSLCCCCCCCFVFAHQSISFATQNPVCGHRTGSNNSALSRVENPGKKRKHYTSCCNNCSTSYTPNVHAHRRWDEKSSSTLLLDPKTSNQPLERWHTPILPKGSRYATSRLQCR